MTTMELIERLRATSRRFSEIADEVENFDHNYERWMFHDDQNGEDIKSSSSTSSEDEDCQKIRRQAEDLAAVTAKLAKCRRELRKRKA